jgi:hypothetical protein
MQRRLKKTLSLLLALVLIVSVFSGLPINAAAEGSAAYLAFISDLHHDTDNRNVNADGWLQNIQSKGVADHLDYIGYCGDVGSAYDSGLDYWKDVKAVMDLMDGYITSGYVDKVEYTQGNHEWFDSAGGNFGLYINSEEPEHADARAICERFLRIGESVRTPTDDEDPNDYIVYCFGSYDAVATQDSSKYGYGDEDINTLDAYLDSAPTDIPIFIMAHFPLHSFGGRHSVNAKRLIEVLNEHPNVVFVWGHNHTVFDPNYDHIGEPGDYLVVADEELEIKFTYTAAGCMSDSEYGAGSHFVQGKGLIVKIEGSRVTFTHYNMDGEPLAKASRTLDMTEVAGMDDDDEFIVRFKDGHTNQVIKYQFVRRGESATEPPHERYEGYIYLGWDKDFDNVTRNLTVTAQYMEKPEPVAAQSALDPNYVYITLYEGDNPARSSKANGAYDVGTPIVLYPIPWYDGMTVDDAVLQLHDLAYAGGRDAVTIFNEYGFDCFSQIWGHTPQYNTLVFDDDGYLDAAIEAQGGAVYYLLAYDEAWITTSFITPDITDTVVGKHVIMQAKTMSMNSDYTYTPKGYAGDVYVGTTIDNMTDTGIDADERGAFTISFDQPGRYYVMVKSNSSSAGDGVAVVNVAPNSGEYVYVNLSIDGAVKHDLFGNYITHYPMVLREGDTVNDILTELHAYAYGKGSAWTVYEADGATSIYCIWGLDEETNRGNIYINDANRPANASTVLQDGDVLHVNGYSGAYQKAAMFNVPYTEVGAGQPLTLTAVTKSYNPSTGTYQVDPAVSLYINIDFQTSEYVTDNNGEVTLQFDSDGTYIVTGRAANSAPAVCVVKVGAGGPMYKAHIPVTSITGVPTGGIVGTPLTLTGTVSPRGATNKTIVWSIKSGNATLTGNALTANASGIVVVTATIINGTAVGVDYTQDFSIPFSKTPGGGDSIGTVYFFAVIDKEILKDTEGKEIVYYPIPIYEGDIIADAITALHQEAYGDGFAWGYEQNATYGYVLNKLWGQNCSNMTYGGGIWTDFTSGLHADPMQPATDGMIIILTSTKDGSGIRTGAFDTPYATLEAGGSLTLTMSRGSGDNGNKPCTNNEIFIDGVLVGTTDTTGKITLTFDTPGTYVVTGSGGTSWTKAVCLVNVVPVSFVAVTDINLSGIPATGKVGTPVTLTGTVTPEDASYKTIVWEVKSGSATITNGNKLTATAAGTVVVTARIENGAAMGTDFTKDYTITFTRSSSGGGGGGGSGGDSDSKEEPPKTPVNTTTTGNTATVNVTVTGETSGKAVSATVDSSTMEALIASATSAEAAGKSANVTISVATGSETGAVSLTIPSDSFSKLAGDTGASLSVSTGIGTITFGADAVDSIKGAAGQSDVRISIEQVNTADLPDTARQQVGNRPVYDFSVTAGRDITSFGGAAVQISVPYTPAPGEDLNSIVIYYISSTGELTPVPNCVYDPATGQVTFKTTHFSKYAVLYKKVSFTDVSGWSKDYISYLAAREIINGTTATTFDPDGKITRAQFVRILANLSGADLSRYKTSDFSDVSTDSWYFAAVQWASENGIVQGSNGKFNPDDYITRQDLAVILTRYAAKVANYTLPKTVPAMSFKDKASISGYAADAVSAVQMAGIISGYADGTFGPLNNATRAEAAKMIALFVQGMAR